jgi:hypothetical protein
VLFPFPQGSQRVPDVTARVKPPRAQALVPPVLHSRRSYLVAVSDFGFGQYLWHPGVTGYVFVVHNNMMSRQGVLCNVNSVL